MCDESDDMTRQHVQRHDVKFTLIFFIFLVGGFSDIKEHSGYRQETGRERLVMTGSNGRRVQDSNPQHAVRHAYM